MTLALWGLLPWWENEDKVFPQERIWRPPIPFRAGWGRFRGAIACPPSQPHAAAPPIPLHSSRQAAIGLLLHDCTPHKVLRPSCLQRSLKFPSLTSLPSSLRGRLWSLPQCTYCRCATATSSTTTKQAGPRSLVPKDKDGPILMVQVLHPADPLRLVLTQAHRPQVQLGSGIPSSPKADGTMYKHTW